MERAGMDGRSMAELLSPGAQAPNSGQYEIVGPRGGAQPGRTERTVVQGEPMPPTPAPGLRYVLVDPTRNGAGKRR